MLWKLIGSDMTVSRSLDRSVYSLCLCAAECCGSTVRLWTLSTLSASVVNVVWCMNWRSKGQWVYCNLSVCDITLTVHISYTDCPLCAWLTLPLWGQDVMEVRVKVTRPRETHAKNVTRIVILSSNLMVELHLWSTTDLQLSLSKRQRLRSQPHDRKREKTYKVHNTCGKFLISFMLHNF